MTENVGAQCRPAQPAPTARRRRRHHAVHPDHGADVDVPGRLGVATLVLKPSERDPSASLIVARLLKEAGCRTACSTSSTVTRNSFDTLLEHPDVKVSFCWFDADRLATSTSACSFGKRAPWVALKNHMVVMFDADPTSPPTQLMGAAYRPANAAWRSGGRCRRARLTRLSKNFAASPR